MFVVTFGTILKVLCFILLLQSSLQMSCASFGIIGIFALNPTLICFYDVVSPSWQVLELASPTSVATIAKSNLVNHISFLHMKLNNSWFQETNYHKSKLSRIKLI